MAAAFFVALILLSTLSEFHLKSSISQGNHLRIRTYRLDLEQFYVHHHNTVLVRRFNVRICQSKIPYYSGSVASFRSELITSSFLVNVHPNPGPESCKKCAACLKTMRRNQPGSNCCTCLKSFHIKCSRKCRPSFYGNIHPNTRPWKCTNCTLAALQSDIMRNESCFVCSQPILRNEISIICADCNRWFHIDCVNSNKDTLYRIFQEHSENWICEHCNMQDLNHSSLEDPSIALQDNLTTNDNDVHPSSDSTYDHTNCSTNTIDNEPIDSQDIHENRITNFDLGKKGLIICHLNIRSLNNKFDHLNLLLSDPYQKFDIFCLSETWLSENHSEDAFYISGYSLLRRDRCTGSHGGGVALYISNALSFTRRTDIENNIGLECIVCEFKFICTSPIIVCTLYRPPNSELATFLSLFEDLLTTVSTEGKEILINGDFNIDLLSNIGATKSLSDLASIFGLEQVIKHPTRTAAKYVNGHFSISSTLIDHFYVNEPYNVLTAKVVDWSISDHSPICVVRKLRGSPLLKSSSNSQNPNEITYRSLKRFNEEDFLTDLDSYDWDPCFVPFDVNKSLQNWQKGFLNIFDKHAPIVKHRVKHKVLLPWLTPEILKLMKTRDSIKRQVNSGLVPWNVFTFYRNRVNSMIFKSKRYYYHKIINDNRNDSKKLWKTLKSMTNTASTSSPTLICLNDKSLMSPTEIAEAFQEHFLNAPTALKSTILKPQSPISSSHSFLSEFVAAKKNSLVKFTIPFFSSETVTEYFNSLKAKGTGLDGLSLRILRLSANYISLSLSKILNLSLETSVFPDTWKLARVTPVFKSGDKTCIDNYRPISVLPVLSKLFERHVCNHLQNYLTEHSLLAPNQSGFRKHHSTETLLIYLTDAWLKEMNKGNLNGLLLIDFRKAFDMVDYDVLLRKLSIYGLTNSTVKWFRSYLTNRKQIVSINSHLSNKGVIPFGVPQGSILGPLLFIMYINDLPFIFKEQPISVAMYADDATLFTSATSVSDLNNLLNDCAKPLLLWAYNNGMALNSSKTKSMVIGTRARLSSNTESLSVKLGSDPISNSDCEKLLGVYIDSTLKWDHHVTHLLRKVSGKLNMIKKIKHFLPLDLRVTLFNSLIKPVLEYCCSVWGNCFADDLKRILKFQKYAARTLLDADYLSRSVPLFNKLKWLPIDSLITISKLCTLFKCFSYQAPPYLSDQFTQISNLHKHSTRSSTLNKLYPDTNLCKTDSGRRTFSYSGSILWNDLSLTSKSYTSFKSFRRNCLKTYLQSQCDLESFVVNRQF